MLETPAPGAAAGAGRVPGTARVARPGEVLVSQGGSPVEAGAAGQHPPHLAGMVPGTVVRPAGVATGAVEVGSYACFSHS